MRQTIGIAALIFVTTACGSGGPGNPATPGAGAPPGPSRSPGSLTFDGTPLYKQAGLLAKASPLPFLGRVAYLARANPDSTHVVIAVSLANNNLGFAREADNRFRAKYTIAITLRSSESPAATAARIESLEEVVVGSFRETQRLDESVIFQEIVDVPPGEYAISLAVRDEGTQRVAQDDGTIHVPRLGPGLSTAPTPIAEVEPRSTTDVLPKLLMSPRATAIAGRDSIIPVYVEQYGAATGPSRVVVRSERGRVVYSDTVTIPARGTVASKVIEVPVSRIGIGPANVAIIPPGATDTVGTGIFVAFGEDLPVATYEEMLNYLRWFAQPFRLTRLREAPEDQRAAEWASFVKETDESPGTPVHEDLREYFRRVALANARYREEVTPGWLSDRGRVFIALGDPDQLIEPSIQDFQRNRQMLWEYRPLNLQLVFYDQTGTGRWRLAQASAVRFEAEFRRRLR